MTMVKNLGWEEEKAKRVEANLSMWRVDAEIMESGQLKNMILKSLKTS